jgi:iron-sulfur cluster insertion protein
VIIVTSNAKNKIYSLISKSENPKAYNFRILVSSGGCFGFQYKFEVDNKVNFDDITFKHDDINVIIDESSLNLISGCSLDYLEDLAQSKFIITNPNALSNCGCGNSFNI